MRDVLLDSMILIHAVWKSFLLAHVKKHERVICCNKKGGVVIMKKMCKGFVGLIVTILLVACYQINYTQAAAKRNYDMLVPLKKVKVTKAIARKNGDKITYFVDSIGLIEAQLSDKSVKEIKKLVGDNNIAMSKETSKDVDFKGNESIKSIHNKAATIFNFWPVQWDMKKIMENGRDYKYLPESSKITIGLVDSGVDYTHPALKNSILRSGSINLVPKGGKDGKETDEKGLKDDIKDKLGHGTAVAGQLASTQSIRGTYPGVKVHVYRVLGKLSSDPAWIMQGIIDSTNNGDSVINVSLGTYELINKDKPNEVLYKAWKRTVSYAYRNGSIIVSSVGEDSVNEDNSYDMLSIYKKVNNITNIQGKIKDVPALLKNVVSVGSTGPDDTASNFSNYGKKVTLFAPGGDTSLYYKYGPEKWQQLDLTDKNLIATTDLNGSYTYVYGTSFATPKVSAILAAYIAKTKQYKQPHKVINFVERKTDRNAYGLRIISGKILRSIK